MIRISSQKVLLSVSCVLAGFAFFSVFHFASASLSEAICSRFTSINDSIPDGYGSPLNVFSSSKEFLVNTGCGSNNVEISLGSGSDVQYIYKTGYVWDSGSWRAVDFSGDNASSDGNWFIGNAKGVRQVSADALEDGGYVVGYVCTWTSSQWKCGCRTSACTGSNGKLWQIQRFSSDSVPPPPTDTGIPFTYYGWYMWRGNPTQAELNDIASYTNMGFGSTLEQLKNVINAGFEHVVFIINEESVFAEFWRNENRSLPSNWLSYSYSTYPGYREKYAIALRQYFESVKQIGYDEGIYNKIDFVYLADEPAIRRNIYLDQTFLNRMASIAKEVFPDKTTAMVFAEILPNLPHLNPPPTLDLVGVDPYFYQQVPCTENSVRNYIYNSHPNSNINWAKQFNKPVFLAGDGYLRNGQPSTYCGIEIFFDIVKDDPDIEGLLWFIYDKNFRNGANSGAANNPAFVQFIKELTTQ